VCSSDLSEISKQIQDINISAEKINSVNSALSGFVFSDARPAKIARYAPQPNQPDDDTKPAIPYLQVIWLITAAVLFSGGIRKMRKFKKQILKNSSGDADRETRELFHQCKKQLKIRGKTTLRTSEYIKTPLVFGLINPFVIFPETDMDPDEKKLAFIHELTHIKNGDLWIKFLASIISTVHWFNPLAHLLRRKITAISEEYCDERVARAMTKEEKFLYASLILKVVSDISATQAKFCSTLSAPTKNIKRRLSNMINTKKSRKSIIALSVLAALILCTFATIYAFAANPDTPENTAPDLPEILDNNTEKDIIDIIDDFKFPEYEGSLGIGFQNSAGEGVYRYSPDGGLTWYTDDMLDPDISASEWLTYDEYKIWLDKESARMQSLLGEYCYTAIDGVPVYWTQEKIDEDIEYYESGLEDLKNGLNSVGIITIGNNEQLFVFHVFASGGDLITDEDLIIAQNTDYKTYLYRYEPDNGGEVWGFGAISYKELYELVKEHFDEWVQAGTMTKEEADRKLADIKNGAYTIYDAEGNIISVK
jgi:beta-lactamase regulating signal transducer with metallopeptidase domain